VKQAPERELLQVILTLIPPRRFSRGLNRRQQKRDQDADDRNHDQQLDQRKASDSTIGFRNETTIHRADHFPKNARLITLA
jgi:hypothetical protein